MNHVRLKTVSEAGVSHKHSIKVNSWFLMALPFASLLEAKDSISYLLYGTDYECSMQPENVKDPSVY